MKQALTILQQDLGPDAAALLESRCNVASLQPWENYRKRETDQHQEGCLLLSETNVNLVAANIKTIYYSNKGIDRDSYAKFTRVKSARIFMTVVEDLPAQGNPKKMSLKALIDLVFFHKEYQLWCSAELQHQQTNTSK